MKKALAILLVLALMLCLGSCGKGKATPATKFDIVGDWKAEPTTDDELDFGAMYSFTGWGVAYIDNFIDVAEAYGWFWVDGKLELAALDAITKDDANNFKYTPDFTYTPSFDKDGALHLTDADGKELVMTRVFEPEMLKSKLIGRFVRETDAGNIIYEFYPDGRALLIREDMGGWTYSLKWMYDEAAGTLVCEAYDSGMLWDTVTYDVELDKDVLAIINSDGSRLEFTRE